MKLKVVGFTGTRRGMTQNQKDEFVESITTINPTVFHHGDCIGADKEAHDLVQKHFPFCKIVVHPGNSPGLNAGCVAHLYMKTKDNLERNRDIVDSVDCMIAAPQSGLEQLRSGTWYTIRYSRKINRTLIVLLP